MVRTVHIALELLSKNRTFRRFGCRVRPRPLPRILHLHDARMSKHALISRRSQNTNLVAALEDKKVDGRCWG